MIWLWIGFILFVLVMLGLDLGVVNRKAHIIRAPEALRWTAFTVLLAVAFSVAVYFIYQNHWLGMGEAFTEEDGARTGHGRLAAMQYLTGWLVEYSLSLDNIFVIALIFRYFRVPAPYQHRVLFWGILGALVMRGAMIGAGAVLIARFHWVVYLFGGLLIVTAVRMLLTQEDQFEPENNLALRLVRRLYPVGREFEGKRFFTRIDGRRAITPLLLVLIVVETSDVLFAVDSIPAIFAITADPFLVFTSNVFAILGLRSLYFALAAVIDKFRFLKPSLVFVLAYVGVKMLLTDAYPIPTPVSLAVICGILGVGVLASLLAPRQALPTTDQDPPGPDPPPTDQPEPPARL